MTFEETPRAMETCLKQCSKCQCYYPIVEFSRQQRAPDGRYSYCKSCYKTYWQSHKKTPPKASSSASSSSSSDFELTEDPRVSDDLYIIVNPKLPGIVKVGRSKDPVRRAKQLSASQPFILHLFKTYEGFGWLERTIHLELHKLQVDQAAGTEWFSVEADDADLLIRGAIRRKELGLS